MSDPFPQAPAQTTTAGQPVLEPSYPFLSEIRKGGFRYGPVTMLLIAVCVIVAVYSSLGNNTRSLFPLFISLYRASGVDDALIEVRQGQVWRLFTPMFIHFGVAHIVFNLIWLKDIGSAVEHRDGSGTFVSLVLTLALFSDVGQYFVSGPSFGGMSGVVYGLFGYVWLRSFFDPASGYFMPKQTVLIMVLWFVFCLFGPLNVANTAHGIGLVVGAVWGFVAAKLASIQRDGAVTALP